MISPACSSQIWNPANNSNVPGNASWSVEIFKANSAQSCGVGWTTSYYQAGDWVTIHCVWSNSAGQTWFYIHDNETGRTGWLAGSNVSPGADNYGKC
ncbi:MAG TPA: hypothetical protein VH372_20690 [Actinospica sp.]|nr:hypothetical protein [Actinospica sp.]